MQQQVDFGRPTGLRLKAQLFGVILTFFTVLLIVYIDLSRIAVNNGMMMDEDDYGDFDGRNRITINSELNYKDDHLEVVEENSPTDIATDEYHADDNDDEKQSDQHITLLVTISPTVMDLIRPLLSDIYGGKCVYSIYSHSHQLRQLEECKQLIVISHQPLYSTHSQQMHFNRVVYLHQSAEDFILQSFRRDYQTTLSEGIINDYLFHSYAQAKFLIWRWHADIYKDHQSINWSSITNQPKNLLDVLQIPYDSASLAISQLPSFNRIIAHGHRQRFDMKRYSPDIQAIMATVGRSSDEIHLISSYFNSAVEQRRSELQTAIQRNINNTAITRIHLFYEDRSALIDYDDDNDKDPFLSALMASSKVTLVKIERQPFYADLFAYANRYLSGRIVLIQNSDIYWQPVGLGNLQATLRPLMVYALSRHSDCEDRRQDGSLVRNHNRNFCINYLGSHDAFALVPPVDPIILRELHFKQNTWGAENVVIEALRYGGWVVENPCFDVIAVHLHCSGYRLHTGVHITPPSTGARGSNRSNLVARPKKLTTICRQKGCWLKA